MKILPLIYPTAAEIWLKASIINFDTLNFEPVSLPDEYIIDRDAQTEDYELKAPIWTYAPDLKHRMTAKKICTRVLSIHLPPKSFIKLTDTVYVASPEFTFLMAARYLTVSQLVKFANNLCAGYIKDDSSEYRQRRRKQITSVRKIGNFLDRAGKFPGVKKARYALGFALDNSGSPMETNIAVMVNLPKFAGGYGLPQPILNAEVKLSADAAAQVGRESLICDMLWEKQKVILEYDSNLSHLSENQHEYDKRRYDALTMEGYRVVVFTASHMNNQASRDKAFEMLMIALGIIPNKRSLEKYFDKRRAVRNELAA